MSASTEDRKKAAQYGEGDVLRLLYSHHAKVHELFAAVESSTGSVRGQAFEQLTALLSAHEAAEESIVRPVTEKTAGFEVTDARTAEENDADTVVAQLLALDLDSAEFREQFTAFKRAVTAHAEAEENDEFPSLDDVSEAQRLHMGSQFLQEFDANGGAEALRRG